MENNIETNKIVEIITEYKVRPKKDLEFAMDFINEDFEKTKNVVLKMTKHLDKLETTYNSLLKEYNSRNGR
jgi:hypothetical protein